MIEEILDKDVTASEFTRKSDYLVARQCCNFPGKLKTGYCITLHAPYFLFKKPCKDCFIFKAISKKVNHKDLK